MYVCMYMISSVSCVPSAATHSAPRLPLPPALLPAPQKKWSPPQQLALEGGGWGWGALPPPYRAADGTEMVPVIVPASA
jgi:hypothetical protein